MKKYRIGAQESWKLINPQCLGFSVTSRKWVKIGKITILHKNEYRAM